MQKAHGNYKNLQHKPVMLAEMLEYLSPKDGETYIDGTFGRGGYSGEILKTAKCKVYAIDRDPDVKIFADELARESGGRIHLLLGQFSHMSEIMESVGVASVNGVVLDIGVSSMQLESAARGFSFMHDGPLDMRMGKTGKTAADLINSAEETELANIIYNYGGEKMSRHIARAITEARSKTKIKRTGELAEIVRSAVRRHHDKIDPATRTFQAIRIWVNDELNELAQGLLAAERLLAPGGRLVVITFHSLEDKIVKDFLNIRAGKEESFSRYQPVPQKNVKPASFTILTKKSVKPSKHELQENIRARSAKLRAAERTSASAWGEISSGKVSIYQGGGL